MPWFGSMWRAVVCSFSNAWAWRPQGDVYSITKKSLRRAARRFDYERELIEGPPPMKPLRIK